ncbi:hypothetical protein Trydic_g11308 [Trypoxylus dichotomus]
MSSGRKRKSKLYPELSTTTVTTSTPIRESFLADAFNISRNLTPSTSNSVQIHTNFSDNGSVTTNSLLSAPTNFSDEEVEEKTRKHVANVGKDWTYFQPQDASTIYRLVLLETDFVKDLAYQWFNLCEKHPKEGIAFMLQFFLDVAGYQTYNIVKVYSTNMFNERNLENDFEKHCPKELMEYTYLLRTNSEWSNNCKAKIYDFIQEIVICANDKQSYKYAMLHELFDFLEIMSHSKIRSIRHTAVAFAAKLIVPTSKLHSSCKEEKIKDVASVDVGHIKEIQEKRQTLAKLQSKLFSIILNNYACQDPQLKDMRRDCMECLHQALHWNPETFFKLNVLVMFTKLLVDSHKEVRLAVIKIFKNLMKSKGNYPYLKTRASGIFHEIYTRTLEEDYTVAIAAVDFFTESLDFYRKEMPQTIISKIFLITYNKYYPLGSAGGRFLYAFISQTQDQDNKVVIIKYIVRFSKMANVQHLVSLLVESLIDCAPELHSYADILDLLLASDLKFEDKAKLLQILSHTVMQNVTGKAALLRNNHREGEIQNQKIEEAVAVIFPRISNLFNMFSEDIDCVKSLVEMLLSFSFQNEITVLYRSDIIQILKIFARHFLDSNICDTLDLISKLFSKVCDDYSLLKESGLSIYEYIFKQCEEAFSGLFTKDKNLWDKNNINELENILLKLQSIFKYHNVPMTWAMDDVRNLFPEITKSNETILRYNLLCGLAYEKRSFQNTLKQLQPTEDDFELELRRLRLHCDEFLGVCYEYLADNSSVLLETAYECICDYTITIADEIYRKGERCVELLQQKTISEEHKSLLLSFLHKFVFSNLVSDSIALRHLTNFCKAIMERGLPFSLLPNVLVYYNSYYDKYGNIFDKILKDISKLDPNVIGIVVSSTLFLEFVVRSKSTNGDFIYFKKLAVQFTRVLSTQSLVSALRFAIDTALREEKNLSFLHYLVHLCISLPLNSKSFLWDYMLKNVNYNIFQRDAHVVEFLQFLQHNKRKRGIIEKVRRRKISSTTSETDSHLSNPSSELESTLHLSEE